MYKKTTVLLIGVLCAAGCLMGPDYKKPQLDLPESKGTDLSVFMQEKWWEIFQDGVLNKLEEEALENNKDLFSAMAKVDAARAKAGIAAADQMPSLSAAADGQMGAQGTASAAESYDLGLAASYQLDLWGKYRRASEAARAELLASEAQKDAVRLTLTADVAKYYFAVVTLDEDLAIARRTLESREETVKIYQDRYKEGYSTELDLKRVEAERASVAVNVSEFERQLSQAQTALAVLLGRSPNEIVTGEIERGASLNKITVIPEVPSGLPADLLTRRPDVREAEGRLMAANADIGVARANYFPSVSLTAQGGYASGALSSLISPSTALWNAGASLAAPIFSGGKLRAQEKQAQAVYEDLLAQYEKAAQNAYKDAYDALVDNQKYREIVASTQEQKNALARSMELSQRQKNEGLIGMLDLLDVERNLLQAELALANAQRNQLTALVSVSQALGGGWTQQNGFAPQDKTGAQENADSSAQTAFPADAKAAASVK